MKSGAGRGGAVRGVERPGGRVSYRVGGDGPPLLLLHATLSSSWQLRSLAGLLASQFRVVSVDRRGSGESVAAAPIPPAPIDVAVHVADLVAIIETERLGPAVVLGHSYGGCVALELAARRPQLVEAVLAYEPPYGPVAADGVRRRMDAVARRTCEAAQRGDLVSAALAFMEGVSGPAAVAALSPAARDRVGRAGTGAVADATLLGMDATGLAAIASPTLIATGAASAPFYSDIARALVDRIPGAASRRLDRADHMVPILAPQLMADVVTEFSRR